MSSVLQLLYLPFFLLLGSLYLATEENVYQCFASNWCTTWRVLGRYEGILFPSSLKTWNSFAGIRVGFIALEWQGKGQGQTLFVVLNVCQWFHTLNFHAWRSLPCMAISALREITCLRQTYLSHVFSPQTTNFHKRQCPIRKCESWW